MNFKDKAQVKTELIYRLWESDTRKLKIRSDINYEITKGLDSLIVSSNSTGQRQKLNAHKVLVPGTFNKDFYDAVGDAGSPCINNLIKGFNAALISYGFTGRGKTHTLFGTDSSYNETNSEMNILTTVFKEVKKHIPNVGVSLNFIEIGYNEQDQSEHVIDLLDFSTSKDSTSGGYDLSGFTTVAIRSQKELENVLSVVQARSLNWNERRDLENTGIENMMEYRNNLTHFLCRINFLNLTDKKQCSFYLVDLIGMNDDDKDSLKQISLHQLNKFFDEAALQKDRIESYKTNRLKNLKSLNTRTGSYSALASQNMKIVDFVANIVLNSQTFFFVPLLKEYETFEECTPLFEKCLKLSTLRYSIEREVVDTTRKINILSCQLFLKTVEGSVNESKTLNFSTNQTEDVINPPFYLANQISPIQKQSENKREILIKDNSIRETPSKKNYDSSEEISLPQKPKFTTESSKIDTLQDQPMRSGPKRTEDYNSDHVFSVSSETGKGGKLTGSFASPRSNQTTSPRNGNTGLSYPPPTNSQPIPKERETAKEEHFTDYSVRAKDVMRLIENFMVTEINTLKKDNLPGEYYVLRKNFDILYRLFKEGEDVKSELMNDFVELGKKVQEFKLGYDQKLAESQRQYQALQTKFSLSIEHNNLKELFDLYEKDMEAIQQENDFLKSENLKLVNQLSQNFQNEAKFSTPDQSIVLKKYNLLSKQHDKLVRQMNERDQELAFLRKRERLFTVEKKMIETTQNKTTAMASKLENKEQAFTMVSEQNRNLEKENKGLKEQVKEQEAEIEKLRAEYYGALERASLFKEMAKMPNEGYIKAYKETKDSIAEKSKSGTPKKVEELDKMMAKLKSLRENK